MDKREEEAAKEKHIVIYASLRGVLLNLVSSFRKRYRHLPIHVHYFSSHPLPIYERIRNEISAGLPTADVVIVPHYLVLKMANEGLLREHYSHEFSHFPAGFFSEQNGWAAMAIEPISFVCNHSIGSIRPSTFDELTEMRWRGKVATQTVTEFSEGLMGAYYLIALKKIVGKSKWESFLSRLCNIDPVYYECLLHMTHALARGEQLIGFPATLRKASLADAIEEGELEQLYIKDMPQLACFRTIALLNNAKHPNVADLFFDFSLSEEWQKEMGLKLDGMVPSRPGIRTSYWISNPLTGGMIYFPGIDDVLALEEHVKIFKEIGLK